MTYDWKQIKIDLDLNVKKVFNSGVNPTYPDFNETLELFQKVLQFKTGITKLDGLSRTILPALHQAYISNKGELNPIKILAEELEPYLKKVIYIIYNKDFTRDHRKSLAPLYDELSLSLELKNKTVSYSDFFNESNLNTFKGKDEYIEYLCHSYIIRNEVHNSPNWDYLEVFSNLKSLLVVYLYVINKHYSILNNQVLLFAQSIDIRYSCSYDEHSKAVYDFVSFSSGVNEIKSEMVTSSILHNLYEKKECRIDQIGTDCNNFFNSNADTTFYRRLIENLISSGKIVYSDLQKRSIKLSLTEQIRIKSILEKFDFQEKVFVLELMEVLDKYGLSGHFNNLFEILKNVFENNYNVEISEILTNAIESSDTTESCKDLYDFLKPLCNGNNNLNDLILDILVVCESNDFLHKLSAGIVFSKISTPEQLINYSRNTNRIVFLDAQVLLYILCIWHTTDKDYDNIYYKLTKDLLDYSQKNTNIKLLVSNRYLNEVSYQLKEALLLIPFEDLGLFELKGSNNVFYEFYNFLKSNDKLESDIYSFSDFLGVFDIYYDDIFSETFIQTMSDLIKQYISDFQVEVIDIPKYNPQLEESSFDIFKNALNLLQKPRHEITIRNDSRMLLYLTKYFELENIEPVFITWDTAFYEARKMYIQKNRGANYWYIFSPSRFLNNLSLIKFEFKPELVTKELLSIIDSFNFSDKTHKYLDLFNEIMDLEKEQRSRYVKKLKEFKKKYVIELDSKPTDQEREKAHMPIESLIKEITFHYSKSNKYQFDDLKLLFSSNDLFDSIMDVLDKELNHFMTNDRFSEELFTNIDSLIKVIKK